MNRWFTLTLSLVLLLTSAVLAAAQSASVAGEWEVTLKTPRGSLKGKATLKQEGEKLSGAVKGPEGVRSIPVEGTIQGTQIKVFLTLNDQDNDFRITLTGEVDGDAIKGKADIGGLAEGIWTAKRIAEGAIAGTLQAPANTAPSGEKIDVSGRWSFEVETSAGSSSPTFIFKQEGETLTGQYQGAFGEAPLTGTVKEKEIRFSFKVQAQGAEVTITYTGTIEKNSMKGTAQLGDLASGTWTAKRQ